MAELGVKAIEAAHSRSRLAYAMDRLLHNLRSWLRVYLMRPGADMPEHDIVWITGLEGGPEATIGEALKAHPELWAHAVPEECCIVPREILEKLLGATAAEALVWHGANIVNVQASRAQYEAENRERSRRYG